MTTVERLLDDLNREGTTLSARDDGSFQLSAHRGKVIEPAAVMTLTAKDLDALMQSVEAEDPQAVFPDRNLETAAYFLVLARIDEEITRYDGRISALHIEGDTIRGVPSSAYSHELILDPEAAPGDYAWRKAGD